MVEMSALSGLKLVVGAGTAQPGMRMAMACRVADHARSCGLQLVCVSASLSAQSDTRYIFLRDVQDRSWMLRIAGHHSPARASRAHFDLITLDGVAGESQLLGFVERIARGEINWFDSEQTASPVPSKVIRRIRRKNIGKSGGVLG